MNIHIRTIICCIVLLTAFLGVLVFPLTASATLGEDETSVQAEQERMNAVLKTTRTEAYTVHEIKGPTGTVVREYVSPEGKVFAVVWQGPLIPDLRKLFGKYFGQYSQAVQDRSSIRPRIRGPVHIYQPGLVVHNGGRMRAYFGYAYVPDLVPHGMNIGEILR
jgi:hypothetical protein